MSQTTLETSFENTLKATKVNKNSIRYENCSSPLRISTLYVLNGALDQGTVSLTMKKSKTTRNTTVYEPTEESQYLSSLYILNSAWKEAPNTLLVDLIATKDQVTIKVDWS